MQRSETEQKSWARHELGLSWKAAISGLTENKAKKDDAA
jgi:hypothetical protein